MSEEKGRAWLRVLRLLHLPAHLAYCQKALLVDVTAGSVRPGDVLQSTVFIPGRKAGEGQYKAVGSAGYPVLAVDHVIAVKTLRPLEESRYYIVQLACRAPIRENDLLVKGSGAVDPAALRPPAPPRPGILGPLFGIKPIPPLAAYQPADFMQIRPKGWRPYNPALERKLVKETAEKLKRPVPRMKRDTCWLAPEGWSHVGPGGWRDYDVLFRIRMVSLDLMASAPAELEVCFTPGFDAAELPDPTGGFMIPWMIPKDRFDGFMKRLSGEESRRAVARYYEQRSAKELAESLRVRDECRDALPGGRDGELYVLAAPYTSFLQKYEIENAFESAGYTYDDFRLDRPAPGLKLYAGKHASWRLLLEKPMDKGEDNPGFIEENHRALLKLTRRVLDCLTERADEPAEERVRRGDLHDLIDHVWDVQVTPLDPAFVAKQSRLEYMQPLHHAGKTRYSTDENACFGYRLTIWREPK